MEDQDWLAQRFETQRPHLRAVAYRMLGSLSEADDAVQEAWLRLSRSPTGDIDNLAGWLTTVVGRVSLDMLRARAMRAEVSLDTRLPDPIVSGHGAISPEDHALIADSVGLALLVVLETLAPAERLAFVLHDMFGVPFDEIAPVVGKSAAATRQLASRARRRVRGVKVPDPDLDRQREVVDAFLRATRNGDFDALLLVLDPDVVARGDVGAPRPGVPTLVRGADAVAKQALMFARAAERVRAVLVNGTAGLMAFNARGEPFSIMGFTVVHGKIVEIDIFAGPSRLTQLDLSRLNE